MAAAAPATLASDSLEVTRSSHLLSLFNPTDTTTQALSASAVLLAARAAKKAARIARGGKNSMAFSGGEALDGENDGEEEEGDVSVADALGDAELGGMEVDVEEETVKIKVKATKVKSSLRKSGGKGMGMDTEA